MLNDFQIQKKFKITPRSKILDIGGAMKQHKNLKIHTLVDLIHPKDAPYGKDILRAKNYIQVDITREKLPFKDDEFDLCLCTHTLEDLYNPFLVIDEMSRVAKKGYIVTPSVGKDMVFSKFDITNWLVGGRRTPGNAHHKWFFVKNGNKIKILPKSYAILYSPQFHIVDWKGNNEFEYIWSKSIKYEVVSDINVHKLVDEYKMLLNKNLENIEIGTPLVYLDNPFQIAKAYVKKLLKRGKGYQYRKRL